MPRTEWTTVPLLPQDKHRTGTSTPSISKSFLEPYGTAMLPSQEVTPGLDKATSPPESSTIISEDLDNTMKPAEAPASPATGISRGLPYADTEGVRMAAPPSADTTNASLAKVTFPSSTIGISEATEPGTSALSNTDHSTSQDPPVSSLQPPPSQLFGGAKPGTGEQLLPSYSTNPSTAGDELPAVTQPQAPALPLATPATVMDVTAAEHVPTTLFQALGSTSSELVAARREPSARAMADTTSLETKATQMGLPMGLSPYTVHDGPGGPSSGTSVHSTGSSLSQIPSADPGATMTEVAASGFTPVRHSVTMSLSPMGASGAKPDGAPQADAAPTSSLGGHGTGTRPATHLSSLVSNTPVSEAGMGTVSLASSNATTMLRDMRITLAVPKASDGHSQPGPIVCSAPLGTGVTPGPASAPSLQAGPQHRAAPGAERWSPSPAPGIGTAVPGTSEAARAVTAPVVL
ncbi:uncharacterized protein [Heliangelus exortis]|uniref:uncharacterized protein n=1 Tax=Heliangelus exortis TaxID=472823 RepID=UPI003A91F18E